MAKSHGGRGKIPRPPPAGPSAPGRSLADLTPRAAPPVDLETFLARGPRSAARPFAAAGVDGSNDVKIALREAREAHRLASDGVRLIRERRHAEAIALLQRAVALNPGAWSSHHDLGVALKTAGRLEQAIEPFAAALRINPRSASAHHNLAYIYDSLGQEQKAFPHYRSAVALDPGLSSAQMRLGGLYLTMGLRNEAVSAFRAAAASASGTPTARVAEVRALEALGEFDDALDTARAAVAQFPENPDVQAMLAQLLGEAGRSTEAVAHNLRVLELSPSTVGAWSSVAANKKFTREDEAMIGRMNADLSRPDLTPRNRVALHFALGKAYDDIGDYEAAMRSFEAGNRIRAVAGRLDRAELVETIDKSIEATAPGYRDRLPDAGVNDPTPILIVGMPRSGSTLTEQILSSHPDVAAGGELDFWRERVTSHKDGWRVDLPEEAARRLAIDYLAMLRKIGPEAKRVTDKALNNFIGLGVIHRVLPNATIIHCRRHPIDKALSIFTTNFLRNYSYAADRSDLVFFTRQYQRLMDHWREVLPPDRLIEVDYEALVADPEPQARRLIAACGLEWSEACLAPHLNARKIKTASLWQARQPIYRTSVERWRRYEPWLGELRELNPARAAWIASGGGTLLTGDGTHALDNTLWEITGTVSVVTGQTFTFEHDDGLTFTIGTDTVVSAPGPTGAVSTTGTYTGAPGNLHFQLVYGECCGGPAVLNVNLPLSSVPEPSTWAMMGLGFAGLGFVGFRRRRKTAVSIA
jgi:tetratricopeptide (TPR) repeat protein